jgi:hypothetical protein
VLGTLGWAESELYSRMQGSWFDRIFPGLAKVGEAIGKTIDDGAKSAQSHRDAWDSLHRSGYETPADIGRETTREGARAAARSPTGQIPLWRDSWFSIGNQAKVDLALEKAGYTDKSYAAEMNREVRRALTMQSPAFSQANNSALVDLTRAIMARFPANELKPPPPPPAPQVDAKVDVKVFLDSSPIAARVEQRIVTNNRTVNSSNGHDGMAAPTYPDFIGP